MTKRKFQPSSIDQEFRESIKREKELRNDLGELVKEVLKLLQAGGKLTMIATKDKKPRFTIEFTHEDQSDEN